VRNFSVRLDDLRGNPQINSIRTFLASAYSFHIAVSEKKKELAKGEFDFYEKLSTLYSAVFTDRKFVGSSPRFDVFENSPTPDFFLSDGHNQYELSEMSAGERAIFPILMDFARYSINNSIIIIDEIELHLHTPLQQAFVRALPLLGQNNQFILTTHSDTVTNMFDESENQIIRLK
jgi:predicted ATPase